MMLLARVSTGCTFNTFCINNKQIFSNFLLDNCHKTKNKTLCTRKTPDLVYFPHVLQWFKSKIGLKILQKTWDPEFSEGAFIYGSIKAICRITEVISNNDKNDELKELLTPAGCEKLRYDMKAHLTTIQRRMIVLTPNNIKLLIPTDVKLLTEENKKICQIGLRSLSVKWHELNGFLRLVVITLQTDFNRDYTEKDKGEWTVNLFHVMDCSIVDTKGNSVDKKSKTKL